MVFQCAHANDKLPGVPWNEGVGDEEPQRWQAAQEFDRGARTAAKHNGPAVHADCVVDARGVAVDDLLALESPGVDELCELRARGCHEAMPRIN